MEEEDGDRQEEEVEEREKSNQRECAMDGMEMTCECVQNLSHRM